MPTATAKDKGGTEAGQRLGPASGLLPGDHACWFFGSQSEHRRVVRGFVQRGIASGGKVLYVADAIPTSKVHGYLRSAGLDPAELVARGQLELLTIGGGSTGEGSFDPVRQVDLFSHQVERALAEGFEGLWVTEEGTWQVRAEASGTDRFLEYEQMVDRFFSSTQAALALCQYEAAGLEVETADRLRSVHNLEVTQTKLRSLERIVSGLRILPTEQGIAVSGEVDLTTLAAFSNAVRRVCNGGRRGKEVVIDLAGVSFIDARGIGLIAEAARQLGDGRRLVLRRTPSMVSRMAGILRLRREPHLVIERMDDDAER